MTINDKELLQKFKSRLKTQKRIGSECFRFCPNVIGSIFSSSGQKKVYDNWINKQIQQITFELTDGRAIKYSQKIHSLLLDECNIKQNIYMNDSFIYANEEVIPVNRLYQMDWNCIVPHRESTLYRVLLLENGSHVGELYLGNNRNVVKGLDDITIDHYRPISKVLQENVHLLPTLKMINLVMRCKNDCTSASSYVDLWKNMNIDIDQLESELNLVIERTGGLVIRSRTYNSSKGDCFS